MGGGWTLLSVAPACSLQNATEKLHARAATFHVRGSDLEEDGSRKTLPLDRLRKYPKGPESTVQAAAPKSNDWSYLFLGLRVQLFCSQPCSAPGDLPQERRCRAGSDPSSAGSRAGLPPAPHTALRPPFFSRGEGSPRSWVCAHRLIFNCVV